MRRSRWLASHLSALAILALLPAFAGCATLGGEPLPRLVIRALDANRFLVENREVSRQKLARAARRAGAGGETEIHLQMAPGQTPQHLAAAYATLQQAGFHRLFLTTPREATATLIEPGPAPDAPKRRRR